MKYVLNYLLNYFFFFSVTFMKGTKDITKSDRVSKEVSDDFTRFAVQKSQISDSGTYFVVARNNNGTDRIFVTVEVSFLSIDVFDIVRVRKSSLRWCL